MRTCSGASISNSELLFTSITVDHLSLNKVICRGEITVKWLINGISNLLLSVYESYESGADTVTVKVK